METLRLKSALANCQQRIKHSKRMLSHAQLQFCNTV